MNDKDTLPEIARSDDLAADKRAALETLVPEAFSEGRLDVSALKRTLGEGAIVESGERYRLDWVGKSEAYRTLQAPTTATLKPNREQSVNFDTASHAFVEGENLEVLKVLQKAYFGQVKMIYIDPPYNTGSDQFVYPDRFQESKEDYLKRIQEMDDEGALLREGQFRKNSRESGHYHSNWLSMMLPRLYIARNLLRDDGVIFVSIDDHEVHNLRLLMNEIFGEENFVACCVWQKRYSRENRGIIGDAHDYLICYAKDPERFQSVRGLIRPTEEQLAVYRYEDERGRWRGIPMTAQGFRKNQMYKIKGPDGTIHEPPEGRCWSMTEKEFLKMQEDGRIYFGKDGSAQPSVIRYLDEVEGFVPWTWWPSKEVGHTDESRKEIRARLGTQTAFDTPKPVRLIRRILEIAMPAGNEGLALDFFAGSGTTLDAVLQQNAEDGGNRRCILIQMAEPLDADNAEFSDIAQVARTRIRAALDELRDAESDGPGLSDDEGFRAFQLVESNFPQWRPQAFDSGESLAEQIQLFMQAGVKDSEPEVLVLELLLKSGYPLTTPIERVEVAGVPLHVVETEQNDGRLVLLLEAFSADMLPELMALEPSRVIALERIFENSDASKKNLALQCRDADVRFESY